MADKHIADCESGFKVIAMGPDACKVGKPVVPFDSMQTLSNKQTHSANVNARGEPVLHVGSIIDGTQSNAGKGVISGTSGGAGHNTILTGAPSVRVNGQPTARHESLVAINNSNAIGQLNTGAGAPNGTIDGNKQPCNQTPKTSDTLEKLKALKKQAQESIELGNDQLDAFDKNLGKDIASVRPSADSNIATKIGAGAARGGMGFLKGTAIGVVQILAGRASATTLATLDKAIMVENIRLGNVCAALSDHKAQQADKRQQLQDKIEGVKKIPDQIAQAWETAKEQWNQGDAGDRSELFTGAVLSVMPASRIGAFNKLNVANKAAKPQQVVPGVTVITKFKTGDCGEGLVKKDLKANGYETISAQNKSGHGVDIVARDANGNVKVIEVKTTETATAPPLSKDQARMGGAGYSSDRLKKAANGYKNYGKTPDAMANGQTALDWLDEAKKKGKKIDHEKHEVFIDDPKKGCAKHPTRKGKIKAW